MSAPDPFVLSLSDAHDAALVGGKAANLARLIGAGLPVPDGFVVTTAAYRRAHADGAQPGAAEPHSLSCRVGAPHPPSSHAAQPGAAEPATENWPDLARQIAAAYRLMGEPPVAVRSSATAEDLATASMAGQYETILDVRGQADLVAAIRRCWHSIDSPRTRAYLAEHGVDLHAVAMAVVVQRLVPADVSGVLFTANPHTLSRDEILIEACYGLGEALVSGLVQPDVLRVERCTGRVLESVVADKRVWIPAGGGHVAQPVEEARRRQACLTGADVEALCRLALACEAHFGRPQDIEWAMHEGRLFLVQSRPITTLDQAEAVADLLRRTRDDLRRLAQDGRGPWVLHNIAETLPRPTPLTWSVIRRYKSGAGGFGEMYRRAGFEPSDRVSREGFLRLVAGRPYMDTSIAPEMFFEGYPFAYDAALLRVSPDAAQSPPTLPTGSLGRRLGGARRIGRARARLRELEDFDRQLTDEIVPSFVAWCQAESERDLAALTTAQLADAWRERHRRTMDEFAPASLLPSLVGGVAVADLRALVLEHFRDCDPDDLVSELSSGHAPDKTMLANDHLYEVAMGRRPIEAWLTEYGHRGPGELDLASPRWRERVEDLRHLAAQLAGGADPCLLRERHAAQAERRLMELKARLSRTDAADLQRRVALLRRCMPWREDGRYYLMMGYRLLRDVARQIGRRLGLGDDVFLLTEQEMLGLAASDVAQPPPAENLAAVIRDRKAERAAAARLSLPRLIEADALDSLGHAPVPQGGARLAGMGVSAGAATGPVRIVLDPGLGRPLGQDYVLVCPSTDPSWTPLFVNAAGLVVECGGMLSHGAVVARELGIPAVVLPDATALLEDGETITVDGHAGAVVRGGGAAVKTETAADPQDPRVPWRFVPPPPGRRDRLAARWRTIFLVLWGIYLAAALVLPEAWLYDPSMRLLDAALWPLVRSVGMVWAVALIALVMAAATMVGQRVMTDNRRLQDAKRRAAAAQKEARPLPESSPRRKALAAVAAPVSMRILGAALVPLAAILGPMVMIFLWLPDRVDPASWSAAPGAVLQVAAQVAADSSAPVTLEVSPPLRIDPMEANPKTPPPVRATLARLQADWPPTGAALRELPGPVRDAVARDPDAVRASLEAYLASGHADLTLVWVVLSDGAGPGSFPVRAHAGGDVLQADVVLGDRDPPAPRKVQAPAMNPQRVGRDNRPDVVAKNGRKEVGSVDPTYTSPLRSVEVLYPRAETEQSFWRPLAFAGLKWDLGWLGVYLAAYLPAVLALRRALGLP